jgi:type IV secretory pathway TrbF-like protein
MTVARPESASPLEEAPQNPYLAARREWNERYGEYIARAHAWRLTAFLALGLALIAVGGLAYLAVQNRVVPYIVAVDKLGAPVAVSDAERAAPADTRIVRAMLARFIVNLRSVYADAAAQRRAIEDAYALLSAADPATHLINSYYREQYPFDRARSETVSVEIRSVLPISERTWQIEWEEVLRSRSGEEKKRLHMLAAATIALAPPQDEGTLLRNPIGLYVQEINWSQQM